MDGLVPGPRASPAADARNPGPGEPMSQAHDRRLHSPYTSGKRTKRTSCGKRLLPLGGIREHMLHGMLVQPPETSIARVVVGPVGRVEGRRANGRWQIRPWGFRVLLSGGKSNERVPGEMPTQPSV